MKQTRGIVRTPDDFKLAFNPDVDGLKECYYDSYSHSYCVPDFMDEWLKLRAFTSKQWRLSDAVSILQVVNSENAGNLVNGYTDSESFCIPGSINYWTTKSELYSSQWRFSINVERTSMVNSSNPSTAFTCYHDTDTDTYCITGLVTVWSQLDDLKRANWRLESAIRVTYAIKGSDPLQQIICYSDELNNYCVPSLNTDWISEEDLKALDLRLEGHVQVVNVFNPSISPELVDCYFDSRTNSYCIPEYITKWSSKDDVMHSSWKFVDGIESLYLGSILKPTIADSFPED